MLLPTEPIEEISGFAVKLGKKRYFFRGTETPFNNGCSANIALNKYCTNKVLEKAGIPVPKALAVHCSELATSDFDQRIKALTFPVVVKPTVNGSFGKDVVCNIKSLAQLKKLMTKYFKYYDFLTIEEFHGNLKSYRVLIFNRRVIGLIQRSPSKVIGDGIHTIKALIELTNVQREAINDALGPIAADEECYMRLNEQGLSFDYIPQLNEQVFLGYTTNASRGGSFVTIDNKKLCKKNQKLMIKVADLLNLKLTGIDVECEDISIPLEDSKGVIIEVNNNPSIKIHEKPLEGLANPVTKKIIRSLIYRHPFSYIGILYNKLKNLFYARVLIVAGVVGLIYKLSM